LPVGAQIATLPGMANEIEVGTLPGKLNERQRLFADAVLNGQTQTAAYRDAFGCDDVTAATNAARLLGNARVVAYMDERRAELEANTGITREAVLRGLMFEARLGTTVSGAAARVQAYDKIAKILGLYQADRRNEADLEQDLLRDALVQFAYTLHMSRAVPLDEAVRYARSNRGEVEAWAVEHKLIAAPAPEDSGAA
jgi:hypothetical protein